MNSSLVKIGLLGCGMVGRALVELVGSRTVDGDGKRLEIVKVLVRDLARYRGVDPRLLTLDPAEIVDNGDIDVVVEVLGNIEPARALVRRALASGKHVVTANKTLISACHNELIGLAKRNRVMLGYEACVCAGLPVLRTLRYILRSSRVDSICGIVNGTCNYILTRMRDQGEALEVALQHAQQSGFAEADPSADLDGRDSAEKMAILSGVAFGKAVSPGNIDTVGIRGVEAVDVRETARHGLVFKLLALAARHQDGESMNSDSLNIRVHPVLLDRHHPLAGVSGETNRVVIGTDKVGDIALEGPGAGGPTTASAILADILDAGKQPCFAIRPWTAVNLTATNGETPYYIRVRTRPDPRMPEECHKVFQECGVKTTTLSISRDEEHNDWQNVFAYTRPCTRDNIEQAARLLATDKPALVAPIWKRREGLDG